MLATEIAANKANYIKDGKLLIIRYKFLISIYSIINLECKETTIGKKLRG